MQTVELLHPMRLRAKPSTASATVKFFRKGQHSATIHAITHENGYIWADISIRFVRGYMALRSDSGRVYVEWQDTTIWRHVALKDPDTVRWIHGRDYSKKRGAHQRALNAALALEGTPIHFDESTETWDIHERLRATQTMIEIENKDREAIYVAFRQGAETREIYAFVFDTLELDSAGNHKAWHPHGGGWLIDKDVYTRLRNSFDV